MAAGRAGRAAVYLGSKASGKGIKSNCLVHFTAPCFARGLPLDMVSFIGNAVGALAVQIVGNKKSVEKYELFAFIDTILKYRGER